MKSLTPKKKRRYLIVLWSLFFTGLTLIITLFVLINQGKMGFMPGFEQLENPKSALASEVYSADQQLIGKYYQENRTVVYFDDLSPQLVNALIATEDVRFYKHSGIDWRALARVAVGVLTGNHKGGGSTLTQQLAKNLFDRQYGRSMSKWEWYMNMALIKFKEWITAVRLERNYTKEEILAMYLNTVPFGSQAFGIQAASKTFFNTTPDSLKLEEAAVLVGLLKAPTRYSPILNKENSKERRNIVLSQMAKYNYIAETVRDSLINLPLTTQYNVRSHNAGLATYFREYLRNTLNADEPLRDEYPGWNIQQFRDDSLEWATNPLYGWCNKNTKANGEYYNIYRDGLKIYTTLDSRMQHYAEQAVEQHLKNELQPEFETTKRYNKQWPFSRQLTQRQVKQILDNAIRRSERYRVMRLAGASPDSIRQAFEQPIDMQGVFTWQGEVDTVLSPIDSILHYKKHLRAGMMSMEAQTGHVKAYVGGINFRHFKYDNVTQARRQVGSTFKPFLYTLAMMDNYGPCDKVPNVPVSFKVYNNGKEKIYTPQYSANKKENQMVSLKYGLANSLNQISAYLMKEYGPKNVVKIAHEMGVNSPLEPVYSLCVGAAELKLAELVSAYSSFADQGIYTHAVYVTRIEDRHGNVIARFAPEKKQVVDEITAFKMLNLMQGVVDFGTSVRLRYKYHFESEIAGKTGTTNNNSDGWFVGLVPKLITGVWVGGEVRSIHFDDTKRGQGASMALPIWAHYMQSVYADSTLQVSPRDSFAIPHQLQADFRCDDELNAASTRESSSTDESSEDLFNQREDLF